MTVSTIEEKLPPGIEKIDFLASKGIKHKIAAMVPAAMVGIGVSLTVLWSAALVFIVVQLIF